MKLVVITGCTRGLGLAMARDFIARGCRVVGCGRSADKLKALQKEFGSSHHFSTLDVSSDVAVARWAARILVEYGPPDLLINNAAVIASNASFWDVPVAQFDAVIDVNVKGVANVLRHFLPAMISRGEGIIVNFSSGWGRSTSPEVAAYCASKWAIEGLTHSLAQELPPGLAAVALNPGIIDTDMLRSCFGPSAGNYPSASEWAGTAVPFFLSLGPTDNGRSLTVPGAFVD